MSHFLSSLSHQALLENTRALVAEEKRLDLALIDHLREIERRMLHLERGYSSLFDFAVKFFGMSEAAAYRRIAAMRLARDVGGVRARLEAGALTLTNAAAVHTFFRAEKKRGGKRTDEEKRALVAQLENLSKRECERKLAALAPETPLERVRPVGESQTEVRVVFDAKTMALIEELKGRLAHRLPEATVGEALKYALEETCNRLRNARAHKTPPAKSGAETRRQIFERAENRCEYKSLDGQRCESRHALEIDHVRPRALGGDNASENLRVLCRQHNAFEAARVLGGQALMPYLPALKAS